jgi:hypothetical protein
MVIAMLYFYKIRGVKIEVFLQKTYSFYGFFTVGQ